MMATETARLLGRAKLVEMDHGLAERLTRLQALAPTDVLGEAAYQQIYISGPYFGLSRLAELLRE
jgi:hypothetical protein